MAILNDYNQIIREHFDITDSFTRKSIIALESEGQETQMLAALSNALYEQIVKNVDKIDFGSIPNSRGDITKVEGFNNTMECLNIIRSLVMEYKENPEVVNVVLTAIDNIKTRKSLFMKSFALGVALPITIYNLIILAIEQSVSFLIATCIQYIKDPASQTFNSALDKVAYRNSKDSLLFEQLRSFNASCLSKEFDDTIAQVIKNGGKKVHEGVECCQPDSKTIIININTGCENRESLFDTPSAPPVEETPPTCPECGNDPCTCAHTDSEVEPENTPMNGVQVPVNGSSEYSSYMDDEDDLIDMASGDYGEDDVYESTKCSKDDCEDKESMDESFASTAGVIGGLGMVGGGILNAPLLVGASALAVAPIVISIGLKALRCIIRELIPLCRNLTYKIISSQVSISDCLAVQAQLIEANANKLEYSSTSGLTDEEKKKVIEKQMKWAERLRKWSNKFAIDNKKSDMSANRQIDEDNKNKKTMKDIDPNGTLFAF